MKGLNFIKIGTRLTIAFLVIIALLLLNNVFMYFNIQKMQQNVRSIYNVRLLSIDYLIESDRDAYQSSIALSYLLNPRVNGNNDMMKGIRDDISENLLQVNDRFKQFEKIFLETGAERNEYFDIFDENYSIVTRLTEAIIDTLEKGNQDIAAGIYFEEYSKHFEIMRDAMDQLTNISLADAEKEFQNSEASGRSIILNNAIIMFVILICLILTGIILTRSIVRPLHKTVDIANRIATGDLTMMINDEGQDETSQLLKAIKNMVEKIKAIVVGIVESSEHIVQASSQLNAVSIQVSQGASEQASTVEEVSSSMEEMLANIQQNSENATETEKIALFSVEGVKKGNDSASNSSQVIRKISKEIEIINEIAFQTNILALNAAVEAARAGDHGKGFAVVAAEVRKLAERSKGAAEEIIKVSKEGVAVAEKAGQQLVEIVPEIEKTAKLVQEIAAASGEQNIGVGQINNAIQQLNQVTQQNASISEEMASSSEELSAQAEQLKQMVRFFSVGDLSQKNHTTRIPPSQKKKEPVAEKSGYKSGIIKVVDEKDKDFEKIF
ncbi:MAG: MCP four helix bundle domain-containing protein [Bacteroidales bacterium]|nr:MCP four helix bundle domain-containing protein [Bacteroidales bacterium]